MSSRLVRGLGLALACPSLCGCEAEGGGTLQERAYMITTKVDHGRLEDHGGLRVLRLFGTAAERGRAHGRLVGAEAIGLLRKELLERFTRQKELLARARLMLPMMVRYPEDDQTEIVAMFAAAAESGDDLQLPGFDREIDVKDALLINAMDILTQMGCSGFTVWGDQVEGGGVLTARNFDWPLTGTYLIESCLLIVQHPTGGKAFATVGWPGYVGAVTGVNEAGIAVFLHVGDSDGGMPRPGGYPTATAARGVLWAADPVGAFAVARELLAKTCPPYGYLTRVVTPIVGVGAPVRVFETDREGVTHRKDLPLCVVTNHFLSRDERPVNADSRFRRTTIRQRLRRDLSNADRLVSTAEAWAALAEVSSSGGGFGTLHSLVFRHEPWVFELAIGEVTTDGGVRAAPLISRRFRLSRAAVFANLD